MRLYLATNLCHIGSEVRRRNYSEPSLVKPWNGPIDDASATDEFSLRLSTAAQRAALLDCEKEQDIELLLYRAGTF
jgi:hypothetical protein